LRAGSSGRMSARCISGGIIGASCSCRSRAARWSLGDQQHDQCWLGAEPLRPWFADSSRETVRGRCGDIFVFLFFFLVKFDFEDGHRSAATSAVELAADVGDLRRKTTSPRRVIGWRSVHATVSSTAITCETLRESPVRRAGRSQAVRYDEIRVRSNPGSLPSITMLALVPVNRPIGTRTQGLSGTFPANFAGE